MADRSLPIRPLPPVEQLVDALAPPLPERPSGPPRMSYEDAPCGDYPGEYEPPECHVCGRPAVEVGPDGPRCHRHAGGLVLA